MEVNIVTREGFELNYYNDVFQYVSFNIYIYIYIVIIIIIYSLEFFTSVLADGFSPEFEWQQVSSSLQDS